MPQKDTKDGEKERDERNRAIVAAMTDPELRKLKAMIQEEQLKRLNRDMESLNASIDNFKKGNP